MELPIELEDVMEQLSLVNRLYAEAAATGSRNALREALEIDPALTGIDPALFRRHCGGHAGKPEREVSEIL